MWIERLMAGISHQHVLSYNPLFSESVRYPKLPAAFLPTDSSPLSPHKKTESTCSGLYVIHQTLTPEPVTASLSVQLRCAAFPPLPADVSGGLPVGSA